MSEQNQSMKGHAFCDVERCVHCINKRCDKLTLKDVDYLTIQDRTKCEFYVPQPPKKYSITLNEDEIADIMTLLRPSSDDGESGEELYAKLHKLTHDNPIAAHMYFINLYIKTRMYGGPEEGGWYYTATECESSHGFNCADRSSENDLPDFDYLVENFFKLMTEWFDEEERPGLPSFDQMVAALKANDYCSIVLDSTMLSDDVFVAIERQPGAQHNNRRQHYE